MRLSINAQHDDDEVEAIGLAIAKHLDRDIELVSADGGELIMTVDAPRPARRDLNEAATDRERRLKDDIQGILKGGPPRGHEKLEQLGKYFVRERLTKIFDEILYEDGTFARYDADDRLPGDAIITGAGRIDGRKMYFAANDYTVKAGTIAEKSIEKLVHIQEDAIESKAPIIYLIDSSGGRIDVQSTYYADRYHAGRIFYNQSIMSGRVPQIAILYGPDFAGTAYQPVFCDFLLMVKDISAMAIASPRIVEMVTGEQTTMEKLGGPEMHARQTGSVDLVVANEDEAVDTLQNLIQYLPQNYTERPATMTSRRPAQSPSKTDTVIPDNANAPYDVRNFIDHVVDQESFLELKPEFAPELVTGLARLEGNVIGIIANQPAVKTGAIYPDSSNKGAGFIWKCDAYNIPLLYLCDTPGFIVGEQAERQGILQKGRKFVYATSCATVPKVSVVVRKAYGAGTYAMSGPAFDTDATLGLPSAQIAVMGPKAAVNAVYRSKIDEIENATKRQEYIEAKREEYREDISIRKSASEMVIDELIPASDLRSELVNRFVMYKDKEKYRPDRKHGVMLF